MDISQFLVWLTGGGSIIAVSYFAEKIAWFESKSAEAKQWIIYGASAVLAFVAYATVTYVSPVVITQLSPFFMILSTLYASIFVGQAYHSNAKVEEPK